jgi:endonuclease YncB( thermonuclease family)
VEGAVSAPLALLLAALAAAAGSPGGRGASAARRVRREGRGSAVSLDGASRRVRWVDGDTFRILDGPQKDKAARLTGYNALESYGPVHRWGSWRPSELLAVARAATLAARAGAWSCCSAGGEDGYGRLLVSCPDAARALVGEGLAMVFAVDAPADPGLLELQRKAQAAGAGMWKKGVPPLVPSSVHSAGEQGLKGEPYDRIVDTRSGKAEVRRHAGSYGVCQEVCVGEGPERACMTYVPFERRYRDRPPCLYQR